MADKIRVNSIEDERIIFRDNAYQFMPQTTIATTRVSLSTKDCRTSLETTESESQFFVK